MDDGRWTMEEFVSAPGDFVTNCNIGDKAVTNGILRVNQALFVTRLVTNCGSVPLMTWNDEARIMMTRQTTS